MKAFICMVDEKNEMQIYPIEEVQTIKINDKDEYLMIRRDVKIPIPRDLITEQVDFGSISLESPIKVVHPRPAPVSDPNQNRSPAIVDRAIEILHQAGQEGLSPTEINKKLQLKRYQLQGVLGALSKTGRAERLHNGRWISNG